MTSRRGFLQTLGAVLGSTVLPSGAVASVVSAAPVAEVAAGVMAVAAVARQFKNSIVLDPQTFEPMVAVSVTENGETHYLASRTPLTLIKLDIKLDGKDPLDFIDHSTIEREQESSNLLDLVVIREQLEREGRSPLTDEETTMIMSKKKIPV
jgi:hypothetical protein